MIPRYEHLRPSEKYLKYAIGMQVAASLDWKRRGFKHPVEWEPEDTLERYCYNNLCNALGIEVDQPNKKS